MPSVPVDGFVLGREDLYARVWGAPLADVAEGLRVSPELVRTLCAVLSVPLPKKGYWLRAKKPRRAALLKVTKDAPKSVWLVDRGDRRVLADDAPETVRKPLAKMPKIPRAHPLVAKVMALYETPRIAADGRLRGPNASSPILSVTDAQKARAFRIADALFKRLESLGCSLSWKGNPELTNEHGSVRFSIHEETLSVKRPPTLQEARRDRDLPFGRFEEIVYYRDSPNGVLVVSISVAYFRQSIRSVWKDEPGNPIEDRLDEIARGLSDYPKAEADAKAASLARQKALREDLARAAEERIAEQLEEGVRERLWKDVEGWQRAEAVRRFVEAVRAEHLARHGAPVPRGELSMRLDWALGYADRIDPVVRIVRGEASDNP